jgi:hypothetical protein
MTAARWKQVQDLFAEAADLPESERHVFLNAACGADADLRRELDSLFRYDSEPGAPLTGLISDASYRALLVAESAAKADPSLPANQSLLQVYRDLTALLALRRDRAGALEISEKMRAAAERIAAASPGSHPALPWPARSYEAQAIVYQRLAQGGEDAAERERDWRAARGWFERSRDAWTKLGDIPELRPVDAEVARLNARMAECDAQLGGIAVPER